MTKKLRKILIVVLSVDGALLESVEEICVGD
jgi:hypothetical protein